MLIDGYTEYVDAIELEEALVIPKSSAYWLNCPHGFMGLLLGSCTILSYR